MASAPKILVSPYRFCPQDRLESGGGGLPPNGWTVPDVPDVDRFLPYPWDALYVNSFKQSFQPVKFWKNAAVLCEAWDRRSAADPARGRLAALIMALVARMRSYTVEVGHTSFIENRFDFNSAGMSLKSGWVSAICNAFAILGCCEIARRFPGCGITRDLRRLTDAYYTLNVEGRPDHPGRWISFVDSHGYLWFDEYPMADGQPTLVLNGHIFAIFALYKALAILPDSGVHELARAGATTVEAYGPQFRRDGMANLYSLRGASQGDYLPGRTVRQQYQLYKMTGARRFLDYARGFRSDMATLFSGAEQRYFDDLEGSAIMCRQLVDKTAKGLRSNGLPVAKLDKWRDPGPSEPGQDAPLPPALAVRPATEPPEAAPGTAQTSRGRQSPP